MSMVLRQRGKRSDIYGSIVETLKTGSYNILQISEKTGINWETVRNALSTLESIDVVSKEDNKYYIDQTRILNIREDTLLGLPLTEEQENKIKGLAARIKEKWNKITSRPLNKTFLQKMMVKLIQEEKIKDIPYGWYLFGLCTVLQLDPQELGKSEETEYDKKIEIIVRDFSNMHSTNELMTRQYTEEAKPLYLSKMKLSSILMNPFTEHSINLLKIEIRNILFSFQKKEDNKDIMEYLNGFDSIVIRLIKTLNLKELEELRQSINESFTAIWDMLGAYNFYENMIPFYGQTAKKYYIIRIEILKSIAESYLTALKDNIPITEAKEDSLSKFKGILASQSQ